MIFNGQLMFCRHRVAYLASWDPWVFTFLTLTLIIPECPCPVLHPKLGEYSCVFRSEHGGMASGLGSEAAGAWPCLEWVGHMRGGSWLMPRGSRVNLNLLLSLPRVGQWGSMKGRCLSLALSPLPQALWGHWHVCGLWTSGFYPTQKTMPPPHPKSSQLRPIQASIHMHSETLWNGTRFLFYKGTYVHCDLKPIRKISNHLCLRDTTFGNTLPTHVHIFNSVLFPS